MQQRTPKEIEALKQHWVKNPCWDIENSEGYEAHREELLNYRREKMREWASATKSD